MNEILSRYPFTAIVGQEELKKGLILNLIDSSIGGILITGEKGVSKSTIVRSMEAISQKKVINLPLNITLDRLVGGIDLEKTLKRGKQVVEKSLLEEANKNILYIDEVNLLKSEITEALLDTSESGKCIVRREGIAREFISDFILIGTMNREMGELTPEFLDRFPMYIEVKATKALNERVEVLKNNLDYGIDNKAFAEKWKKSELELFAKIEMMKSKLRDVKISDELLEKIVKLCLDYGVKGHRADIYIEKVARAICAYNLRNRVIEEDIFEAASYVLPHRLTKYPEDETPKEDSEGEEPEETDDKRDEQENSKEQEENRNNDNNNSLNENLISNENISSNDKKFSNENTNQKDGESQGEAKLETFEVGDEVELKEFLTSNIKNLETRGGKREKSKTVTSGGFMIGSTSYRKNMDIALLETIKMAAPYQKERKRGNLAIKILRGDLKGKVKEKKASNFLVFLVDSSGSLGANKRMVEVKGAIFSMLKDSYVKRDYVSLVVFRGQEAEIALSKTNSVERAYRTLKEIKTGGKTPLNSGLVKSLNLIKREVRYDDSIRPILVIISDGKGNVPISKNLKPKEEMIKIGADIKKFKELKTVVIDIEKKGMMSFGLAKKLGEAIDAEYISIENLKKNDIVNTVNKVRKEF